MAKKNSTPAVPKVPAVSEQSYYLQRAHIKDYRSIRDAKVEFKPGLNIIIGKNGSGKTNFVRVVGKDINMVEDRPIGNTGSFVISGRQRIEFAYEKALNQEPNGVLAAVGFQPKYKQTVTVKTAADSRTGGSLLSTIVANYSSLFPEEISFLYQTLTVGHGVPAPYPIVADQSEFVVNEWEVRQQIPAGARLPAYVLKSVAFALFGDFSGKNGEDLMMILSYKDIDILLKYYLNSVMAELRKYTPIEDIKISSNMSIYYNSIQREFIVKGFAFDFKILENWLPFHALSSGTQRLFYIISELVTPSSTTEFNKEGALGAPEFDQIILLEEPELGIHPHQLHLLLNFLREQSEKHQIIITTHSPQVLDMLKEDELDRITICELHETKGTQFRKLKKTQIVDARRYMKEVGFLSDYWRMGDLETSK